MAGAAVIADLVVVGAGIAGWTAALRAQELGARVVVVDKCPQGPGWGNSRLSGGVFHAAYLDPRRPPDELSEALVGAGAGHVRPELARAWAATCGRALAFLEAHGASFAPRSDEEWQAQVLEPFQPLELGQPWRGTGPDRLLSGLWRRFVAGGGAARFGARAVALVRRGGGPVAGVVVEDGRRREVVEGRAVVVADGGFQADRELVAAHITPTYRLRGADSGTGDGIRMGLAVGAQLAGMPWFYGHCMSRDALWDNRLWPFLSLYGLAAAGVVVDGSGRRFADEGVSNQHLAQAVAASATPGGCWVVADADAWAGPGAEGPLAPNPTLADHGATVVEAATVAELAGAMGVPGPALAATVAAFAPGPGGPPPGGPGGGGPGWPPRTGQRPVVGRPPFVAVPLVAGITFTMGGLAVDPHGRVLDGDGVPVPGLYAAGGAMGGLQGGPKPAYAGGWSEAATFGLLAAEHAVGAAAPAGAA